MTEYAPSLEEVRDATSLFRSRFFDQDEFDRWYQAEVAAAEQRGAIKALRGAAEEVHREARWQLEMKGHILAKFEDTDPVHRLLELERLFRERVNQIEQEGDDE